MKKQFAIVLVSSLLSGLAFAAGAPAQSDSDALAAGRQEAWNTLYPKLDQFLKDNDIDPARAQILPPVMSNYCGQDALDDGVGQKISHAFGSCDYTLPRATFEIRTDSQICHTTLEFDYAGTMDQTWVPTAEIVFCNYAPGASR